MIKKWVRILPYFFVVKLVRKFGPDFIQTKELGQCRGWRVDEGEWILWSQQNYDRMKQQRQEAEQYEKEEKEEEEKKEFERLNEKYGQF